MEAMSNIHEETLNTAAGGYIYWAWPHKDDRDCSKYWDVIDDRGNVLQSFNTRKGAVRSARLVYHTGTDEISFEKLCSLRSR